MKRKFTLLAAALMLLTFLFSPNGLRGQSRESTTGQISFNNTEATGSMKITDDDETGTDNLGNSWHVTTLGTTYFYNGYSYTQIGSSNNQANSITFTTTLAQSQNITAMQAKFGGFSGTAGTITLKVGDETIGSGSLNAGSDVTVNSTSTFTGSVLTVTITNIAKGVKCYYISYTYEESSSSSYTVTYDANDATSGSVPTDGTQYEENAVVTVLDNTGSLAKAGYTWSGWNTQADGNGTDRAAGSTFNISANTTLYAKWTANTYAVTLPTADTYGTYTMNVSNPVAYGTNVTLTYTPASGYEYYAATWSSDDVTITNGTFTMPDKAVTVAVSVSELPKYTVTYSDGGSVTEEHHGAGVTLAPRSGDGTYTFAGWTTSNILSETTNMPTIIPTNITYFPTANITLYPVYTRTEGSGYKWVKTALSDVTAGTYAMITPSGYAFNGSMSSGHGQVTSSAFSFTNNEAAEAPDNTRELELSASGDGFTMKDNSTNKYLYASAASSGKLAWHDTESSYWRNNNGEWVYNSNTAYLRYYNGSPQSFRTYASTSSGTGAIQLAKKVSNAVTYYVSSLTSIAIPTFTPTSQNFSTASLLVTITVASDCHIKYTTNDWESWTETSSNTNTVTIEIDGTTTVKAKAKKGSNESAEASETYTRVYAITLMSNGVEKSIEEVVPTESITLSAPDNVPDGFAFVGWTATPGTPGTLVNTNYTPTGNITLYASFAQVISRSYDKVTSASGLTEGEYIITTYYESKYYTIKSNTEVSNPIAYEQTVTDDAITGNVAEITWSFTGTSSAMAIKSTSQNLYLNTINQSTGVRINSTSNDSWTISFNNTENCFTMKSSNGGGSRYLSVFITNNAPQDWRNYYLNNAGSYQYITLFKKNETLSTERYIRVFQNETATAAMEIIGPSIIPSGSMLNMGSFGLTNTTAANLVIEDGGQLITSSDDVAATVKKDIAAWSIDPVGGWYFIASPISTTVRPEDAGLLTDALGGKPTYDLYYLDNTTWKNYRQTPFNLNNGQGYLYADSTQQTLAFTGTIKPYNTTNNTVTLTKTGWNLIGNPFTCAVTVDKDFNEVNNGSTVTNKTAGSTINPCAGIAVNGSEGDVVTFTKPTSNAPIPNNLSLVLAQQVVNRGESSSQTLDNAIVSFNEGGQLEKFYFGTQNANLYIPQGAEEYAIVNAQAQGEMPVSFRANENGQYTLTVNPEGVEMNYLHLIDNMTGTDVDLLATPSYTFNAQKNDLENRFKLVFAANNGATDSAADPTFAFFSNGNLIINNAGEATLQVIDITGRVLSSETINGGVSIGTSGLTAGVYVLRLVNGKDTKVQKIVVR